MNFQDVVSTVAKAAPTIAGALGGPGAAEVAGWVASMLGVEGTPAGMVQAAQDPNLAIKLKQMDQDHEREIRKMDLEARTKQMAEVNATMRAELESGSFWQSGWRAGIGWSFMLVLGSIGGAMAYNLATDPTLAGDENFMTTLVWVVVSMSAALGINVRTLDAIPIGKKNAGGLLSRIKTRN